ncbi:unnamed protein product, partial [Prorocentrum cordatum]
MMRTLEVQSLGPTAARRAARARRTEVAEAAIRKRIVPETDRPIIETRYIAVGVGNHGALAHATLNPYAKIVNEHQKGKYRSLARSSTVALPSEEEYNDHPYFADPSAALPAEEGNFDIPQEPANQNKSDDMPFVRRVHLRHRRCLQ